MSAIGCEVYKTTLAAMLHHISSPKNDIAVSPNDLGKREKSKCREWRRAQNTGDSCYHHMNNGCVLIKSEQSCFAGDICYLTRYFHIFSLPELVYQCLTSVVVTEYVGILQDIYLWTWQYNGCRAGQVSQLARSWQDEDDSDIGFSSTKLCQKIIQHLPSPCRIPRYR